MKNLKTFSLAITMLISFLSFGQNLNKIDSTQVVETTKLSEDSKTDISQSLIENVSGLQIKNTNSGSTPTSRIVFRCKRDSTANKLALIIIDDKIATIDEFTKLEPKNVDNVSVIKGLEAAKLYGVNGANGVIVVKTKLDTNQIDPKTNIKVDGNNNKCKSIAENVVGAMGIVKKKDAQTYSTQIVKSKELTQCANPNLAQSLIGKVSGLQINTTDNSVNPTSRIIFRGNRSISGNNEALIVIDNVISTTDIFTALAPESVDSINVIKGVQGAALYGAYGAYGANGVIMVRTKEGCDEDISVELDSINNEVITNQLKDQNNINTTRTYKIEVSNQNISETLVEKVKGLQISKTNNGINPTSRIVFRCGRSLADDKEALIVIDDKIATTKEFQKLDTNLIDNVKIIKGEQATALYGVKGSNGVIVVKTKQQFYE